MSLTVHEALSLKALERFKLVAGANGLNNRISRVGLIDHETPETLTSIIMPQEFLFSNMIMIKDHPEQMIDYIESIIASKAACFALKTIFFDEFPDEVIEYANRHKFPLFTFDKTYIEDIILEVDQALNVYSQIAKLQGYVDEMTSSESDPIKVRSLALKLNKSFSSHFMVTTLEPQDTVGSNTLLISTLNQVFGKTCWAMEYDDTILLISTFQSGRTRTDSRQFMTDYILTSLERCGLDFSNYMLGLSTPKETLGHMGHAILESKYALEYAHMKNIGVCHFDTLGIYQILLPNRHNPWFHVYYESMIQKLIEHDEKHDSDLLHTAAVYVQCDANIQLTADKLFQHVNTVRYRIRKIKSLLGIEGLEGMAYETLAAAIHLYLLHENRNT